MVGGEITVNILDFILGGNANVCIVQDPTTNNDGGKMWFSVRSDNDNVFFVSEGDGQRRYIGYFTRRDLGSLKELRVAKKKNEIPLDEAKPLIAVLNRLTNVGTLWDFVHVYSDGRCSVCGRRLTNLESIPMGIGPECRKKLESVYHK